MYKIFFIIFLFMYSQSVYAFNNNLLDVKKISLQDKIGQMIIVTFNGQKTTKEIEKVIKNNNVSGIALYYKDSSITTNINSQQQLVDLTDSLKKISVINLFIITSQAGIPDINLRVENKFSKTHSQQKFGTANNLLITYEDSFKTAQMLLNYGFNTNNAPNVNVNYNKITEEENEYFSENKNIVIEHSLETIKAHADSKVINMIKFFPYVNYSSNFNQLQYADNIDVFQAIFNKYNSNIMLSLAQNTNYTNIVKTARKMGFLGVISLEINNNNNLINLVNADINLFITNYKNVDNMKNIIIAAVQNKQIDIKKIDESYIKIMKVKKQFLYN